MLSKRISDCLCKQIENFHINPNDINVTLKHLKKKGNINHRNLKSAV